MSAYREDKLYLAALVGWGIGIASTDGWWRVGCVVVALMAIVLHRVNQRPPRTPNAAHSKDLAPTEGPNPRTPSESVHEPGEGP